jgi:DNA-binding CsgD family transcriptional regulator
LRLYRQAEAEYHALGFSFLEEAMVALTAGVLFEKADYAASRIASERSLTLGQGRRFTWAISRAKLLLAHLASHEGDRAQALSLAQDALRELRVITDPSGIAIALRALSQFAFDHGNMTEACDCLTEAVDIACAKGDNLGLARTLEAVVCVIASGAPAAAAQIAGAASQLRARTGTVPWPSERGRVACCLDAARQEIGDEAFGEAWSLGLRLTRAQVTAMSLRYLDWLSVPQGCAIANHEPLTPRQREVAELIARGLTNNQIAEELVISPATARAHVEHILDRLDRHSRAQIAAWAAAGGS